VPRVVAEMNVFLSALLFGGPPEEIINLARQGQIDLLVSPPILLEFASVLKAKFEWHESEVADAVRSIGYCSTLVRPISVIEEIEDDPDNRVLECAVDGEAEFIVSGDHHLLELESFKDIHIMKARDVLDILSEP
jgi:putative PIN family toxin of toxin-antitoxin system